MGNCGNIRLKYRRIDFIQSNIGLQKFISEPRVGQQEPQITGRKLLRRQYGSNKITGAYFFKGRHAIILFLNFLIYLTKFKKKIIAKKSCMEITH